MIRIGVLCPSEIAYRRFMPALYEEKDFHFVGIGVCSKEERFGENNLKTEKMNFILEQEKAKAERFIEKYGGKIFPSYQALLGSGEIDAIYIPLPPALHFLWSKKALEQNIHVLVEKPATISAVDAKELVKLAGEKKLALHENYMFAFHNQLEVIKKVIDSGEIGTVRLYRISFGFPRRAADDFRYNKILGGGALIDAGGYTVKYASMLLGETASVRTARLNYTDEFDVDVYGSATLMNEDGMVAQIAFGMDNSYKCELQVWGSKGYLTSGRILTAPAGFIPEFTIESASGVETRKLPSDDTFLKSIKRFKHCITDETFRNQGYQEIMKQAQLIEQLYNVSQHNMK